MDRLHLGQQVAQAFAMHTAPPPGLGILHHGPRQQRLTEDVVDRCLPGRFRGFARRQGVDAFRGTFLGEAITTDAYQTGTFAVSHSFTSDKKNDSGVERDLSRQARKFTDTVEAKSLVKGYDKETPC